MVNTILAKRINHIVAKGDNPVWPKGSKSRGFSSITANEDVCRRYVHDSIGVVTALNPVIGYKNSTRIAKEALETGKGVYELVLEHNILSKEDLDTILKPENMIKPVKLDIKPNLLLEREARSGM